MRYTTNYSIFWPIVQMDIECWIFGSPPCNRSGWIASSTRIGKALTAEETAELDTFERFEHLVRLLKARVLQKQSA
jgi:hypothetical protein